MAVKPFVVAPKDYAPALNIVGEHVTVLASGEATEGYEVFLQRGPEGQGGRGTTRESNCAGGNANQRMQSLPSRQGHADAVTLELVDDGSGRLLNNGTMLRLGDFQKQFGLTWLAR